MKIRQERINVLHLHWRMNKNVGPACLRKNVSIAALRPFEHTDGRRSDGDDTLRGVDCSRGRIRYGKLFAVHPVLRDVLRLYRLKCPGAHMQRDKGMWQAR